MDVIPRTLNVPIGLFGWSVVPPETTDVILCADVFDVMVLSQQKPVGVALALPKGWMVSRFSASTSSMVIYVHIPFYYLFNN